MANREEPWKEAQRGHNLSQATTIYCAGGAVAMSEHSTIFFSAITALADAAALWATAGRITEFGFSPNHVAALGENVILLVNLLRPAVLYIRFLRGRGSFIALERWQTAYVPVYATWAAIVVIGFPLVFGSI